MMCTNNSTSKVKSVPTSFEGKRLLFLFAFAVVGFPSVQVMIAFEQDPEIVDKFVSKTIHYQIFFEDYNNTMKDSIALIPTSSVAGSLVRGGRGGGIVYS